MPLIALYGEKALAELGDVPKKRPAEEQTLDKWFGTSAQKKAKADEAPAAPRVLPKAYQRVIVVLCFLHDAPALDPKSEQFPREIVANAGADVRLFRCSTVTQHALECRDMAAKLCARCARSGLQEANAVVRGSTAWCKNAVAAHCSIAMSWLMFTV